MRWRTTEGYVDAYEHRVIARAQAGTHVHHVDGDTINNDPANLVVLTPVAHQQVHAGRGRRVDIVAATRLYESGVGTERIGKFLGFNPASIYRALKRAGVQMRPGFGGPERKLTDS